MTSNKLDLKPTDRAIILHDDLGALDGPYDFIQFFAPDRATLETALPQLRGHLAHGGKLWLCWTKKASPKHTDLTDNDVRELGLATGLVDIKVASIDDDWSGLKFVYHT
jgi:hypothetical protein